jgi:PAS domain S-box-containing protein
MAFPTASLRLLLLEDDPLDSELIAANLAADGLPSSICRVQTEAQFAAALDQGGFHLILADYSLPDFDGLRALDLVQARCPEVPFLFVSGALGEERAIESLQRGATDYVLKSGLTRLGPAVRRALREAEGRAHRERAERELRRTAEQLRFQADLLNVVGQAVAATDLRGQITFWNRAAETLYGWPAAEAIGQDMAALAVAQRSLAAWRQALAQAAAGDTWAGEVWLCRRTRAAFPARVHLTAVHGPAGAPAGVVSVATDLTEQLRAELAQRVLAEAGRALSSSLDYETQLRGLAAVVVPLLADWCAIDVLTEQGALTRLALTAGASSDRALLDMAARVYPPDLELPHGPGRVLKTMRPELIADLPGLLAGSGALPPDQMAWLRGMQLQSAMIVPLVARGQPFGVLTLATAQAGRQYSAADLAVAEELARRAALAGDNARLFAESQRLNAQLEQRVADRTAALLAANAELHSEVAERIRAEAELAESREQLRGLSARLEAAREEERTRLAREVHDELGGALTSLKMDVARLRRGAEAGDFAGVGAGAVAALALIDQTIHTVRRIATDLRPGILDDFGLIAAIEWQLQEFEQRSGLECHFATDVAELDMDPDSATAVFRVFQETLTNVARHAQASRVEVRLSVDADDLTLEVSDNGRGISENELFGSRSLGLLGMRERVHLLVGELEIRGQPGVGTVVRVRLPLARLKSDPPALAALP